MSNTLPKSKELAPAQAEQMDDILSNIVLKGDISQLKSTEKVQYYNTLCKRIGIDPMMQPFQILKLQGKEVLYATKGCTEQLRMIHGISVTSMTTQHVSDCYIVQVAVQNAKGRIDFGTGAVSITNSLKGDALANALMKAETKAKRRATLSICGLGMLDETELETIPGAEPVINPRLAVAIDDVINAAAPTKGSLRGAPIEKEMPDEANSNSASRAIASPAPANGKLENWRTIAKDLGKEKLFEARLKSLLNAERVKSLDQLSVARQETITSAMGEFVKKWQK